MAGCKAGDDPMSNIGWLAEQPESCYFYPARDCPGWSPGGTCSRIGEQIPDGPDTDHERRLGAVEAHLADLEQRLNERGIFSGDPPPRTAAGPCTGPGCDHISHRG
jgi:hypothetical protein